MRLHPDSCRRAVAVVFAILAAQLAGNGADVPLSVDDALKSFATDPGLRVELVAAEPLIQSPSALAWDERGRLFVAENPGYPVGPGPGRPPVGAIVGLTDTDGDGRMDRRTVLASGLGFPNGLMPWRGGWLVTDAPLLWWFADTDADGVADVREVWFSGFATNQTTQLRACYPTLGPDGWIYLSRGWSGGVITSPKWTNLPPVDLKDGDFRFRPDGSAAEAIGANGQFGLVVDDVGRRFIVSNRNPLMHAVVLPRWWRRNPALAFTDVVQDVSPTGYDAKVFPRSPDTTTSGFMPELMGALHAGTFTAACGIHQYSGDGLGAEYQGSWFICEPAQSLVQRQIAEPSGPTFSGRRATEGRDFLSSSDGWFRPVYAATGPDGALYLADLYRRIIDHPDYLPEDARKKLDFDSGKDMGRLWRVLANSGDRPARVQTAAGLGVDELVSALGATNVWLRQTAHRLLVERGPDTNLLATLVASLENSLPAQADVERWTNLSRRAADAASGPHLGTARRLWLASEFLRAKARSPASAGGIELSNRAVLLLLRAAFDPSPSIRETLWRIASTRVESPKHALPDVPYEMVYWWADDPSPAVRFHFALLCGEQDDWTPVVPALLRIARRDAGDRWTRAAVLSGLKGREASFISGLFGEPIDDSPGMAALFFDLGRMLGAGEGPGARSLLEGALKETADGKAWQAAALRGLAEGLRSRGGGTLAVLVRAASTEPPTASSLESRFDAVAKRMLAMARDSAAGIPARVAAIQFLGELDFATSRDVLAAALATGNPDEVRLAAVRTLGRFDDVEAGRMLVEPARWSSFPQPLRDAALGALTSRTALLAALFDAIERGDVPVWAVDPQRRRQLQNHADAALRDRARELFESAGGSDRRQVYAELRPVLDLPASGGRGRAVFQKACANCHTYAGEGVNVGPDLTGVKNQPPEALLLHIVVPDAEIYPGFQACEVETRDGRSLSGLLAAETPDAVVLRQAGGTQETIRRANVASLTPSRVSLMPQELEKTMERQELADLIAYLRGQR